jgi:hypothetical protein
MAGITSRIEALTALLAADQKLTEGVTTRDIARAIFQTIHEQPELQGKFEQLLGVEPGWLTPAPAEPKPAGAVENYGTEQLRAKIRDEERARQQQQNNVVGDPAPRPVRLPRLDGQPERGPSGRPAPAVLRRKP